MQTQNGPFKTRTLDIPAVLVLAVAVIVVTCLAQSLTDAPTWKFDSAVRLASGFAVLTGMGWTLFQLMSQRNMPDERRRWALAFFAMAVLGAVQATDWLVGSGLMADDWLVDLPFWLAASALVYVVLRRGSERRIAVAFWQLGLVLQLVFIVCDLWEGKSLDAWSLAADELASIAAWSRLLAIECYVVALVLVDGTADTNHVLSAMRRLHDSPYDMKDKVLFAARCRQAGLPVAQTLLESSAGGEGVNWHVSRNEFDRDLFCKPRGGRNSLGNLVFHRIAKNLYRDPEGDEIDLDTVLAWVDAYSRTAPVIVQPRLKNHPEIADLANQSLVTVRVLTCLDSENSPVLTHAFLRIKGKLEPKWGPNDTYGVPIDLTSGRLEAMTTDRVLSFAKRFSRHPLTGVVIEGRVLHTWPEIRALALKAHRAFPQRIIAGWDIAMTEDGALLLAGNISPELMFLRRHDRDGISRSPLGPLLLHHLSTSKEGRHLD